VARLLVVQLVQVEQGLARALVQELHQLLFELLPLL
jgi:hypothetical protein